MDKAREKAIKERYRVAVRRDLFRKLKGKCSGSTKVKRQNDILQAAIHVSS